MLNDYLRERLRTSVKADFELLLADFRTSVTTEDPDAFVGYLYEQGHIDAITFRELISGEPVESTVVQERNLNETLRLVPGWEYTRKAPSDAETVMHAFDGGVSSPAKPPTDGTRADTQHEIEALRYNLIGMLGKGAMGAVYLARDKALRRRVAFKTILPEAAKERANLGRFVNEAQITSQMNHPNVVPIYGLEILPDGSLAYTMKIVEGVELEDILNECRQKITNHQPLDEHYSLSNLLDIILKVCEAISFAHARGVVHRDLKPSNIMVGQYGQVYVMDWGIAKVMAHQEADDKVDLGNLETLNASEAEITHMGMVLGTPLYMSPEQAKGLNYMLDGRSDLYTLGLILQELLTLRKPRFGTSLIDILKKAQSGENAPLEHLSGHAMPRELIGIVKQATAFERDERYTSVETLIDDTRRYQHGEAVLAAPDNTLQHLSRWAAQHRMAMLILLLIFVFGALAATGIGITLYLGQAELKRAHRHEMQLSGLLVHVSSRAQIIDAEFRQYEGLLEYLVGSSETLLIHSDPGPQTVYYPEHFQEGRDDAPSDLAFSSYYGAAVSLDHPVFQLAANTDLKDVEPQLRKLKYLQPIFLRMMLRSHHDDPHHIKTETTYHHSRRCRHAPRMGRAQRRRARQLSGPRRI